MVLPGMRRKNTGQLSASGFLDFRKPWQVSRRLRRKRFRTAITWSPDKPKFFPTVFPLSLAASVHLPPENLNLFIC
jgi:hypothetical protein